ncbi:MAG: type II toxin-antitoxin system ParD family antitoxin [Planctomycetia bacterium]|nr:type II toxin-antitoxin system ParD family antitoxin [Planctomycetia bacterium]
MSYQLPSDVTQTIQSLIATGKYASQEDVLRDALDALRQRDEDLAAITAGIEDMQAGRYRPFVEIDAEFRQRHNIPRTQ